VTPKEIFEVRARLQLTQEQFAQLLGVHGLTVSKWERGVLQPTPYQVALMHSFTKASERQPSIGGAALAGILIGAGVAAALFMLLKAALDDSDGDAPKPKTKPKRA